MRKIKDLYNVILKTVCLIMLVNTTQIYADTEYPNDNYENIIQVIGYMTNTNRKEFNLEFDQNITIESAANGLYYMYKNVSYSIDGGEYQGLKDGDAVYVPYGNSLRIILKQPLEGDTVNFKLSPGSLATVKNMSGTTNEIISMDIELPKIGDFYLAPDKMTIYEGETRKIGLSNEDGLYRSHTLWENENTNGDTIDIEPDWLVCTVIGKKAGIETVSVHDERDPENTRKSCQVTVIPYDGKGISIESIDVGETIETSVSNEISMLNRISPSGANIASIKYEVDNPEVVEVVGNKLYAAKGGSTKVTVKVTDMDQKMISKTSSVVVEGFSETGGNLVSTPVADILGGKYTESVYVELSTDNDLDEIYYTTDGSKPTINSTLFRNFVYIDKNTTLKAVANRHDYLNSEIATFEYKIVEKTPGKGYGGGSKGGSYESEDPLSNKIKKLTKEEKREISRDIEQYILYTTYEHNQVAWDKLSNLTHEKFTRKEIETIINNNGLRKLLGIDDGFISNKISLTPIKDPSFKDVTSKHWAYQVIKDSCELGLVAGMPDGTFAPSQSLKMADTFTFLDRLLLLNNIDYIKLSRDTVEKYIINKDHWALNSISSISSRLSESTLKTVSQLGDKPISRELLAQVVYEVTNAEFEPIREVMEFEDINASPYKEAIEYCIKTGLLNGVDAIHMMPNKSLTRAELMAVLIRLDDAFKK